MYQLTISRIPLVLAITFVVLFVFEPPCLSQQMSFSVYTDAHPSSDYSMLYVISNASDNSWGCYHSSYTTQVWVYSPTGRYITNQNSGLNVTASIPIDDEYGNYGIAKLVTFYCSCFRGTGGCGSGTSVSVPSPCAGNYPPIVRTVVPIEVTGNSGAVWGTARGTGIAQSLTDASAIFNTATQASTKYPASYPIQFAQVPIKPFNTDGNGLGGRICVGCQGVSPTGDLSDELIGLIADKDSSTDTGSIKLYFVKSAAGSDGTTYNYRDANNQQIYWNNQAFISDQCGARNIAHEMGHVQGLPHVTRPPANYQDWLVNLMTSNLSGVMLRDCDKQTAYQYSVHTRKP